MYTEHGKETSEQLWKETLDELRPTDVLGILESMKTL